MIVTEFALFVDIRHYRLLSFSDQESKGMWLGWEPENMDTGWFQKIESQLHAGIRMVGYGAIECLLIQRHRSMDVNHYRLTNVLKASDMRFILRKIT